MNISKMKGFLQGEEEVSRLAERMQNLLRPFVLRRLKTEVANQLAPKQHRLHTVPMTAPQAELYGKAVAELRRDVGPKKAAGGECEAFVFVAPIFLSVA